MHVGTSRGGSISLKDFVDGILRKKNVRTAAFRIDPDRVLDGVDGNDAERFVKEQTYFEIRLSQMYLRDAREYWREFVPLGSILTEFLYDGERRVVPTVVGPALLKAVAEAKEDDRVEYLNTRVAGPYPYEGDDLTLFVGLFRIETTNWAAAALSMLETVAKVFDTTKLSASISVAGPLVEGVEGLLGMDEVEMRMGKRHAYESAADGGAVGAQVPETLLAPAYEVLINRAELYEDERRRFWVKNGRLHVGASKDKLSPYGDADFALYRLQPLTSRDDYTTFDFERIHWKKVENHIWEGRAEEAQKAFRLLAVNLVECPDIVRPHRNALLRMYKQRMEDELARADEILSNGGPLAFDEAAGPAVLGESDFRQAVLAVGAATSRRELAPEQILAEVGV